MNLVSNHWWMLLARGVASFALALLLLLGPAWSSLQVLAIAFAIYAILDGAGSLAFVFGARGVETSTYVGRGLVGLASGAVVLAHPPSSTVGLYLILGIWAIATGGLEVAFGSRTWSRVPKALGFMLVGTLSIGLGITALHFTHESVPTLRAFLAAYAVMNGIAALAFGERVHGKLATAGQAA